ncbi:protein of unknown function [Candidatus Hydrogenisulfobacillus filiaventi]|uniref:Uncharacterized protein n=1 Tax=Candidatus Hydrogenisulfobacillus filiaventi TaxID=2707344 RepID=A0A6F8ZJ08_9FIRM|nr:protein of unknown function [Candidatus Hydrogenisulfobacillus filiaventi]
MVTAALAWGVLAAGCGPGAAPAGPYWATAAAGGRTIRLTLRPAPVANRRTTLSVRFSGAAPGGPVTARLTMNGMVMPPLRVALAPAGDGRYRGSAIFTMAGSWSVHLRWPGAGAVFTVPVRP